MGNVVIVIFALLFIYFFIFGWVNIFSKAGYRGALGFLMFVPIVNLIMFFVLAFGEWPIYKEGKIIKQ